MMIDITGNEIFDLFIMNSKENKDKVLEYDDVDASVDEIFEELGLSESDFTDIDLDEMFERLGDSDDVDFF